LWRHLNVGLFAFLGTSYLDGKVAHTERELHLKLVQMLNRFKYVGLGMLAVAGLLQIPWVVAIVTIVPYLTKEALT